MKKQIFVTAAIYLIAGSLALFSFFVTNKGISGKIKSPLGTTFSVLSASSSRDAPEYSVYGFMPYWVLHKAEYLQLDKLTDIAYFALRINPDGTIQTTDEDGFIDPGYDNWKNSEELEELIKDAKAMNVRFALTIISHEDEITYEFLDCRECWDTLYSEIERELLDKGITDLNMDFELVEADSEDGYNIKYSQLVNFLNARLDEKFGDSFVVTSTLPDSTYKPRITDIQSLSKASDALFIMAYDFHRPTSDNAGPVAPVNGKGIHAEYDISTMLSDYLSLAPASKLILGIPYYGYNWLVYGGEEYSERIPGNEELGYSMSQTYEDIAETRLEYNPEVLWDEYGLVPYFTYYNPEYGTTRQVYYEDKDSLKIKYDMAKNNGLAGVGIWALGYDGGFQELWEVLAEEIFFIDGNVAGSSDDNVTK